MLGAGSSATACGLGKHDGDFYPRDIASNERANMVSEESKSAQSIMNRKFGFLHTKMILTDRALLLGSANWTSNSMKNGFDLSVLLNTERQIHEGLQLFELLWASSGRKYELTALNVKQMFEARG